MRAHIIENSIVVNTIEVESLDLIPGLVEATEGAIGWHYENGVFTAPTIPASTPEQIQSEIVAAVQSRLDAFAKTRNYDGILSAATYATSTVEKFRAEGQRAVELRDLTWAALYAILGQVLAGEREMPAGYADIEAELPALLWADEVQPEPAPEPAPPTPEPAP